MKLTTKLYVDYKDQVFNFLYYKVREIDVAEDLTSDVFIRVSKANYDPNKCALSTWFRTIANSVFIDYYRKHKESKRLDVPMNMFRTDNGIDIPTNSFASNSDNADNLIHRMDEQVRVARAFRILRPVQRKVAIQYFLRERTYNEIVKSTGLPMGSVKAQLFRARKQLIAELELD